MRGYQSVRNTCWRLSFDPLKKTFVQLNIQHPFHATTDCLAQHLLQDIGIEANALAAGRLALLETDKPAE